MRHLLFLPPLLFCLTLPAATAQPLQRHELDKSESRRLTLDNKLEVLLVSDPKFNKSAAALEVGVGSLSDPEKRQGLAHFLEHMLFLGTEKYPDVQAYSQYLKQQGGYSNAFTAGDRTNYHFEVHHDALDGALDRFAQFFISPLFTPEYIDREVKAVQSEHKKNLMNDGWREYQLLRNHMREDHPANHFSTGNEDTLNGIARPEFINFYKDHYSANQMALVILSNKPLDALETMARTHFSPIENRNLDTVTYPPNPLPQVDAFRLIQYEPVKELRELSVAFSLPATRQYWQSKPAQLVGYCLGHEGKGSLLSHLKDKGWATGLSAGPYEATPDYGQFSVTVQLTEAGFANYRQILSDLFSYVHMLRDNGIPKYVFDEAARLAALDYAWSDKGEGTGRAVSLASTLRNHPEADPLKLPYQYDEYRPDLVKMVVAQLRPDNMIAILSAKGVETDATCPYYGTKYSFTTETGDFFASLKNAPLLPALHVPKQNRFISQSQDLLAERPVLLVDEPGARLYYAQDVEFRRPKMSASFRFRLPADKTSAKTAALAAFYGAALNEQLNELAYPAREAGVHYGAGGSHSGVSVSVSGYSDSAGILLDEIKPQLTRITLSDDRFAAIKERIVRGWRNFPQEATWQVTREIGREVRRETNFLPEELLAVANEVTLDAVKDFPAMLFAETHLEGMIHGNVSAADATAMFNKLRQAVNAKPAPADACFEDQVLVQPAGELLTHVVEVPSNNSCFWRMLVLGGDDPETRAAARILDNFMSQPFYTEMRTKQQLGYIVWAVATADAGQNYLAFIIQSGDYPADELRNRADKFAATLPDQLAAIDDAQLNKIRDAVRSELLEKTRSIAEKAGLFETLAFNRDADFDRIHDTVAALDAITKDELVALFRKTLAPATRRGYDVLTFAAQHKPTKPIADAIKDLDAFRKDRTFARNPK